ncbi:MAG: UDP-N-acetylmuramoyl-L-alanine--D-glutamate ligase [Bacteroidales bacterium]|jgi:UDP-N-acetylmuramoylalanine--D-glutamate ligase|nr:UDP-N-acetylmuramoyl-L-alanine--D-glutamate ligase [Bacteroidales bacterium]MBQ1637932.1 UDP-N-acetylmuramoyl-L-alanine--D-glutamate ligase [Bacteroidales bacterium]MBQ1679503.1 UDP-N-acetylmuramoyl-L-alanine--D-glutamate ligase [Bacteroidales bacterium]MBQ1830788.1 UDP-N-acetylmuramoyl-L-alanine--D-glutamate ligase [Bacteroidales bacterium]MBQ2149309.1 UDP-N-acetylmuramoyl-L-alanine--D-glutamate ligase [Bacteroidales bacterium]
MKKAVILGGGESGVGAAVLAKVQHFDTFLSDSGTLKDHFRSQLQQWDIPFEEGGHTQEKILDADVVIKSPGIPETAPLVVRLKEQGTPVISEIEFAGYYDTAKKICITGSNGKTTTTSLIYYLLQNAGLNVGLGGNIGRSYAMQVATEKHDIYVLEISSFQLDGMYDFRADIAVLMNITPDHLDRYDHCFQNYINAKFRITRNLRPEDCFIFCSDDEVTIGELNKIVIQAKKLPFTQEGTVEQGAWLDKDTMRVKVDDSEFDILVDDLALEGRHNVYNSMAAAITGKIMHITNDTIRRSLTTFEGVEHRMEKVMTVGGVLYVNDSKATNVNSTWYALESMTTPVVLILGGTDKGNDYTPIAGLVREKVKAIVCMGVDNKKIIDFFTGMVPVICETDSAEACVAQCAALAEPGDTVLLSPCCASFDLFKNYEDRGRQFKEAVRKL